jgi:hypothetical protein
MGWTLGLPRDIPRGEPYLLREQGAASAPATARVAVTPRGDATRDVL